MALQISTGKCDVLIKAFTLAVSNSLIVKHPLEVLECPLTYYYRFGMVEGVKRYHRSLLYWCYMLRDLRNRFP